MKKAATVFNNIALSKAAVKHLETFREHVSDDLSMSKSDALDMLIRDHARLSTVPLSPCARIHGADGDFRLFHHMLYTEDKVSSAKHIGNEVEEVRWPVTTLPYFG